MAEHKKSLNENLDKLELIIQNPRSYLTYYLNDLRNEIDASFKQRRMNETNEKQRNLIIIIIIMIQLIMNYLKLKNIYFVIKQSHF